MICTSNNFPNIKSFIHKTFYFQILYYSSPFYGICLFKVFFFFGWINKHAQPRTLSRGAKEQYTSQYITEIITSQHENPAKRTKSGQSYEYNKTKLKSLYENISAPVSALMSGDRIKPSPIFHDWEIIVEIPSPVYLRLTNRKFH